MIEEKEIELSTTQLKLEKHKLRIINNFLKEIGVNKNEFFEYLAFHYMKTFFIRLSSNLKNPECDPAVIRLNEEYYDGSPTVVHKRLDSLYNNTNSKE